MPGERMRALLIERPAPDTSTTHVGELPIPEPGPGQVLIRVTHAGVNFKDVMARRGDPGYVRAWPFVPGLEVNGFVHATGADVDVLTVGQPVVALTGEAGLAEFVVADAHLTVPLPDGIAPESAAAAPGAPLTAALLINEFGHLQLGETIVVHSAGGGVGHAAAQFARLASAGALIGTVGNPSRIEAAERNGYHPAVVRGPELTATVHAATGGRGADLILDPQGTTALDLDLEAAGAGARIILFGNATGAPFGPLPALAQLMGGVVSLTGFSLAALAVKAPEFVGATLRRVLGHLAAGALILDVTVLDGLEAAPDAQQALAEARGATKYVVQITP
jgi:NADPH2:quinone reductase